MTQEHHGQAKAGRIAARSSRTAASRQAITTVVEAATAVTALAEPAEARVQEKATTIITVAAEIKEVMTTTGADQTSRITAAVKADAAVEAAGSSRRARKSTIRRRKLLSAAQ